MLLNNVLLSYWITTVGLTGALWHFVETLKTSLGISTKLLVTRMKRRRFKDTYSKTKLATALWTKYLEKVSTLDSNLYDKMHLHLF